MAVNSAAIFEGGQPSGNDRPLLELVDSANQLVDIDSGAAYETQQAALEALPDYPVAVVRRKSYKDPVTTSAGTFFQETVRYDDGAVRLASYGIPKVSRSPFPVIAGDPWYTGPDGFNAWEIENLVADGYPVIWNHHQGRHSLTPTSVDHAQTFIRFLTSKSVGKSAAQDHALLDDLSSQADFNTDAVLRKGYSRSAMSGEAFIAQAASSEREVLWSDMEAACFAKKVGHISFLATLARQLPSELKTLGQIMIEAADQDNSEVSPRLANYAGTVDIHPLNLAHEAAWLKLLISGDTGIYARAIPLDARGIRTVYSGDLASQQAEQEKIHAVRNNLEVIYQDGTHLSGATRKMLLIKQARFQRLGTYMDEHDNDLSVITPADILVGD